MYRLILESLLGLKLEVNKLTIVPCVPLEWKSFKIRYRYRETMYHINVMNMPVGINDTIIEIDGIKQENSMIILINDLHDHHVEVQIPYPQVSLVGAFTPNAGQS